MQSYLESVQKQFQYYKQLGEGAMAQLSDQALLSVDYATNTSIQLNSIAVIVKHIVGNMKSRWTNIYEEDGEKPWRDRDDEFVGTYSSREEIIQAWETGWKTLFAVLDKSSDKDLQRVVYIRNMGHSLTEAINRQMMHYAYHIGQIVQIAKMIQGDSWKSLSIPLESSKSYNDSKFAEAKSMKHFTDEFLPPSTNKSEQ